MAIDGRLREWASSLVSDPEGRQNRFRRASLVEGTCASLAALSAFIAIWGFTQGTPVLGAIPSEAVGGIAVLCFAALMMLAAGAGIEKRFLALVSELEKRE